MSWQRILESARRLGAPVIVTDIAGREPMVILPFEQYDRLLDGSQPSVRPAVSSTARKETVIPIKVELKAENIVTEELPNLSSISSAPTQEAGDLTLEERFYLEPVEEDGNS